MKNSDYISVFSGIGGLEHPSIPPVLMCEMDKDCHKIIHSRSMTKFVNIHSDITTLNDPPPASFVVGGWPCQDLSMAGLQKGLLGKKSSLFFDMIRIAQESNSHTIIGENVPNLLRVNKGKDFQAAREVLVASGYKFLAWRILNAREFGLPQDRNRLFLVASKSEHKRNVQEERLWWGAEGSNSVPAKKKFLFEIRQGAMPKSILNHEDVGHTDEATKELRAHVPSIKFTPKPTRLMRHIMRIAGVEKDDLILDCFAGTGSMGEAVLAMEDEGEEAPTFILIQLPELVSGVKDKLSAILIKRLQSCSKKQSAPKGFKVFSLEKSNFKIWNGGAKGFDENGDQLELHVDHVSEESSAEDILYELLLKAGFELTTKIEKRNIVEKEVFSIAEGALLICLEKDVTAELIDALAEADPIQVICLDEAFKGNDQLKTNAVQTFASRAAKQESEIVFRTV